MELKTQCRERFKPAVDEINEIVKQEDNTDRPILVAIDGRCGSGKTTLGEYLKGQFDCNLFHMDDFFLRMEQRTPDRMKETGGNVDYERFYETVLIPVQKKESVCYQPFSCKEWRLLDAYEIPYKRINIIEGSYSLHPYFGKPYQLKIFMNIASDVQLANIRKRNGEEKAKEFQEYREAAIAQEFDLDEVSQRILNADGASWIKKVKDKSTCFQLDPFHRNKAVKEKIHEETARNVIMELLREEEIEELFRYLEIYRNSLSDEDEIEDVEDLIRYYENNQKGLLPYQSQNLELPDPPEGLEYRNMGTMENHVWSVIAKRMKHGHRSWSRRGGNHLAKILAKKCSGKLYEVTERLRKPVFEEEKVEELYGEILMSAKAPKKDGKGYEYPALGHIVGLNGKIQGERKRLLYMAGY